ncbi:Urea carboxylase-related ABC transporter, substrate-binding protein [Olavius algarvensis associated proteobacterium Delta 3]|nr:Urea carboxylase-related ABC transporter, substrate-binding protein [Olavius algarvensis associated proteobacterium Delta 3]CAB5172499.1 Urea carboxylase-related ABC transporter, substrate-binding protein [Olavius algarvensis associated proteobacterium Delta 3]
MIRIWIRAIVCACLVLTFLAPTGVFAGNTYRVAWSHYTGWEPWEYARNSGILDKWAAKYGIKIQLDLINDYIESINLYTGGAYQGCVMTNMDALTIPAIGGIDSTALIIGDFSNGNDGIVMKKGSRVKDLKGRQVKLVELSVSHYLLARALSMNSMKEKDLKLINTSDADIAAIFTSDPNGAVVTWNPPLMQCRNVKGAKMVFDSSQVPGEIIDMMVVRTDSPDKLKKALVGAWYETMSVISSKSKKGKEAIAYMANFAGGTEPEFRAQLRTTAMFYNPADAVKFTTSDNLKETMAYVRDFSFSHGLFGDADNKDVVGISFPDGSILGSKSNIKMRFDASFMKMAADGKL